MKCKSPLPKFVPPMIGESELLRRNIEQEKEKSADTASADRDCEGFHMNKVFYDEVAYVFRDVWVDSAEHLFHEIAWDCLEKEGYTTYSDEKMHAMIHVYAYVIQMLCEEFFDRAYDETCAYDYETPDEEPLTDAAIGWLYRDVLSKSNADNMDEHFSSSAREMLVALMYELRYTVADVIFDQLGKQLVGTLLHFSVSGAPLQEDETESPADFQTKEELLDYCKQVGFVLEDVLTYENAMRAWNWLDSHSCALDE